jgi:hypothetical protein
MSIAAKISPAELVAQVTDRYVDQYYEGWLINAPGTAYQPGITDDATFLTNEVAAGTGGYQRQVIKYIGTDVGNYADDGIALATKATVFAHDGGGTSLDFSHVALVKGTGNVQTLGAVTAAPSAGVDGTYTNIPVTTGQSGSGLTVDLTITNSGAAPGDYALTIVKPGFGYVAADGLQIAESVLVSLGAVAASAGDLTFSVGTATTGGGALLAVAQTANTVSLTAGNEAAFYWNLKQYGYYSV